MIRRNFLKNSALGFGLHWLTDCGKNDNKFREKALADVIKPPRLQKGDKVGLVAPAYMITEEQLGKAINSLDSLGLKPVYTERILGKYGYLSGKDEDRAQDFNEMIANSEIKGIVCARGGYGTTRILELLDYDLIRKNPKVIMGFSDITSILNSVYQQTGLVTFHGPVGTTLHHEYTLSKMMEVVLEGKPDYRVNNLIPKAYQDDPEFVQYTIKGGKAKGQLCGGNLTLVTSMLGTPYQINTKDKILILEDVGEEPYRMDRMLTQLLSSGSLHHAAGIAIGISNDCDLSEKTTAPNSLSLREVIEDRLSSLDIPVAYGFLFGHHRLNSLVPVGVRAEMDADIFTIQLLENAVS